LGIFLPYLAPRRLFFSFAIRRAIDFCDPEANPWTLVLESIFGPAQLLDGFVNLFQFHIALGNPVGTFHPTLCYL
jgi:hypothetical protein